MEKGTCAFTGHRPHKFPWRYDETDSRCVALKAVLAEQISALDEAGVKHFLSGMAEAVDTWAALSVLDLREKDPAIKLHCILPCTAQAEKWSASSRELYRSILERADSVVYVSRNYHKDCMLDRNRFLVDHATILLAVYNGEQRGGTAATIRYAQKLGREIVVIDPITRSVTRRGVELCNDRRSSCWRHCCLFCRDVEQGQLPALTGLQFQRTPFITPTHQPRTAICAGAALSS